MGILSPVVRHADSSPSRRDTVALVAVSPGAVLDLHPERGVGLPASPKSRYSPVSKAEYSIPPGSSPADEDIQPRSGIPGSLPSAG